MYPTINHEHRVKQKNSFGKEADIYTAVFFYMLHRFFLMKSDINGLIFFFKSYLEATVNCYILTRQTNVLEPNKMIVIQNYDFNQVSSGRCVFYLIYTFTYFYGQTSY